MCLCTQGNFKSEHDKSFRYNGALNCYLIAVLRQFFLRYLLIRVPADDHYSDPDSEPFFTNSAGHEVLAYIYSAKKL